MRPLLSQSFLGPNPLIRALVSLGVYARNAGVDPLLAVENLGDTLMSYRLDELKKITQLIVSTS